MLGTTAKQLAMLAQLANTALARFRDRLEGQPSTAISLEFGLAPMRVASQPLLEVLAHLRPLLFDHAEVDRDAGAGPCR